ncbi:MAG: hypothetical protein P4M07_27525 [Xanthobacteraceae bacterium]|nr:hypothetical protein [Xanthobacteraceae bacterium]
MQPSLEQAIAIRQSAPARCPDGRFEGRGIVICAGGKRYFTCAWVLIAVLRRVHRCTLPIQVWHLGRREMSEEMRILLEEEGVEVVDAEAVVAMHPARVAGGWPLKPYAIAHSRFREVLYLDADTVPLVDPEQAFAWAEYMDNGLLLWPDVVDVRATNPVWARLGLAPVERASVDSGVLLADKTRAWDMLDLAIALNEHCDEVYDLIHGDKDTFLLSALLLNRTFGFLAHRPFLFDWDMVQRDPSGEPFLHHRSGAKWFLDHPNRPLVAPGLMPACEAALADLRRRWSGTVFQPPERSTLARAEEERLVALRHVRLQSGGSQPRDVELLPGGRVGAGREYEQHWAVIDGDGAPRLRFYGYDESLATLDKTSDGAWVGLGRAPGNDIVVAEPGTRAASKLDDVPLPTRSSADLVAALAQPAWFAAGYDADRAASLAAALSLVNDAFDDVPEQVLRQMSPLDAAAWRGFRDQLVSQLAARRDQRVELVRRSEKNWPRVLSPNHYARPA